jgi:hypothetical protein
VSPGPRAAGDPVAQGRHAADEAEARDAIERQLGSSTEPTAYQIQDAAALRCVEFDKVKDRGGAKIDD